MPARHETSAQRWRALHGTQPGHQREQRARRAEDPLQREADRLRWTQRWRRLRAWFLRGHPLCASCLAAGRTEPAVEVDHVVPLRTLLAAHQHERAFDPANLQALCAPCHARKSAAERGARRAHRPRGAHPTPPGGEGSVSTAQGANSARCPQREFSRVSKVPGETPPGAPVPDTRPGPASVEAMAAVLSHVHGLPRAAARGQITAALDRGDRHLEVNDDHR